MKRIILILLAIALVLGVGVNFSYAFDASIHEDSVATKDLRSLNFLLDFAHIEKSSLKASAVASEESHQEITAREITDRVETEHAIIYGYKEAGIPDYLAANFDRVFAMVTSYLNIKAKNEKLAIWIVDFDTLQESYPGQKGYPGGSPNTVAALYAPHFNYFFFTPRYMNDYYVAHELIHHFIDEYQEEFIAGLPQVITQRNTTNLPLGDFISQHEEEIAVELPQIIIRKNLASFALASTKSYQK